eukprot:13529952-Alexandrium_andersonii.AAC.1
MARNHLHADRLHLMNQAVGSVLLWASETIRPTVEHVRRLVRLERAMARLVFRLPRRQGGIYGTGGLGMPGPRNAFT